jgi:hypothetical protein
MNGEADQSPAVSLHAAVVSSAGPRQPFTLFAALLPGGLVGATRYTFSLILCGFFSICLIAGSVGQCRGDTLRTIANESGSGDRRVDLAFDSSELLREQERLREQQQEESQRQAEQQRQQEEAQRQAEQQREQQQQQEEAQRQAEQQREQQQQQEEAQRQAEQQREQQQQQEEAQRQAEQQREQQQHQEQTQRQAQQLREQQPREVEQREKPQHTEQRAASEPRQKSAERDRERRQVSGHSPEPAGSILSSSSSAIHPGHPPKRPTHHPPVLVGYPPVSSHPIPRPPGTGNPTRGSPTVPTGTIPIGANPLRPPSRIPVQPPLNSVGTFAGIQNYPVAAQMCSSGEGDKIVGCVWYAPWPGSITVYDASGCLEGGRNCEQNMQLDFDNMGVGTCVKKTEIPCGNNGAYSAEGGPNDASPANIEGSVEGALDDQGSASPSDSDLPVSGDADRDDSSATANQSNDSMLGEAAVPDEAVSDNGEVASIQPDQNGAAGPSNEDDDARSPSAQSSDGASEPSDAPNQPSGVTDASVVGTEADVQNLVAADQPKGAPDDMPSEVAGAVPIESASGGFASRSPAPALASEASADIASADPELQEAYNSFSDDLNPSSGEFSSMGIFPSASSDRQPQAPDERSIAAEVEQSAGVSSGLDVHQDPQGFRAQCNGQPSSAQLTACWSLVRSMSSSYPALGMGTVMDFIEQTERQIVGLPDSADSQE